MLAVLRYLVITNSTTTEIRDITEEEEGAHYSFIVLALCHHHFVGLIVRNLKGIKAIVA